MPSRLASLIHSLSEQVLSGMGLQLLVYEGSEDTFRSVMDQTIARGFQRLDVLGTDGRHGESVSQIVEQFLPGHDYEALLQRFQREGLEFPSYHAQLLADIRERRSKSHAGLQLAQVTTQLIVREAAKVPVMLTFDNLGVGYLDLKLLLALSNYPHVPVLVVAHVSEFASHNARNVLERLKVMTGNRIVLLTERISAVATTDRNPYWWPDADFRRVVLLSVLLGRVPSCDALIRGCQRLGIADILPFQTRLRASGHLTENHHWQWVRMADVIAIRRMFQDAPDHVEIARAAADAMASGLEGVLVSGSEALRFAEICELAAQPQRALAPLRHAARDFHIGEGDVARRLMLRHAELLQDPNGVDAIEQLYVLVHAALAQGERETARALCLELLEKSLTYGHPGLAANSQRLLATMAWDDGRTEDALTTLNFALETHRQEAVWSEVGQDLLLLGWWSNRLGRADQSRELYAEAMTCFHRAEDHSRVAETLNYLAVSQLSAGQVGLAATTVAEAAEIAAEYASTSVFADVLNTQSEIARLQEDWELAHTYASQAHAWFKLIGHKYAHIARFNLGLIALGAQHYSDARAIFEELTETYARVGLESRLPVVEAGIAVAALAWRDDTEFDDHLFATETAVSVGFRHADLPWLIRQGVRLAQRTGQSDAIARLNDLLAQIDT